MRTARTRVLVVAATAGICLLAALCLTLPRAISSQPYQQQATQFLEQSVSAKLDQILANQHTIMSQLSRMGDQINRTWENTRRSR